jgi:diacylglycerol kinase (ATP)
MKPAMRRAALIYNPASGQHSARRGAVLAELLRVFREAGVEADAFETGGPGSAMGLAERVVSEGYDSIVACGGDGTVHEIVQTLVGSEIALGVFPLGTANALASDLGLIGKPDKVAQRLLQAKPSRVSVGRIHFRDTAGKPDSRYFVVAAGVGADALLMSRLDPRLKRRLGYVLYLLEAARIWATDSFPLFRADFAADGNGTTRVAEVSQLLAVRVRSFGGVLRTLAPGASLRNGNLSLLAFATRSRISYMRFLLAVIAGRHTFAREIELLQAASVECYPRNGSAAPIFVEADGEVLGSLPVRLEVVPHSLTLLIPPGAQP